jgi:ABC-type phosphate transport system substrate-binding protein
LLRIISELKSRVDVLEAGGVRSRREFGSTTSANSSAEIIQLHGSGTTNPRLLLWKAMSILEERAKVPVRMTYRAVGSSTGQAEFLGRAEEGFNPLANFGSGDIPFSNDDYSAMVTDRGQEMAHIPFVMGAISFFHTIPSGEVLDLDACLLARIFSLDITMWDDKAILEYGTNQALASVVAGKAIKVVRRVHGSSSTSISTSYLGIATKRLGCDSFWPSTMIGKGKAGSDGKPVKAPFWGEGTFAAQGSQGVQAFLEENEFAIGYLDAGHGVSLAAQGVKEVALTNKAEQTLTSQSADLNEAAAQSRTIPSEITGNWGEASLLDIDGNTTWPMMTFSYLYVKKDMSAMGESGALVKALVEFILSEEGQSFTPEFGFVPVPPTLATKGLDFVRNEVALADGVTKWDFELPGVTDKYGGTKNHIFSGKRTDYHSIQIEKTIADSTVLGNTVSTIASTQVAPVLQLHGSGTTNPRLLLWKAMSILEERAKVPVRMTYRAVGSGTGQKEFVGREPDFSPLANFGSGDIPLSEDMYSSMQTRGQGVVHVPFVLGGISIFHSIPTGEQVDLDACLLARIFKLNITTWDDEEIIAFGSNSKIASVLAGKKIKVVRRVFGSSSTSITTGYLRKTCPQVWTSELTGKGDADKVTLEPTKAPFWPAGTIKAQGSDGVADYLEANDFAIGYIDSGHGVKLGLKEVALRNRAGKILTSQTASLGDVAEFASLPVKMEDDWSKISLLDQGGENTWPLMAFSYLYIRTDMSAMGEAGGLVKALTFFLLSNEGQALLGEFGFAELPASLLKRGRDSLEKITYAMDITQWEFESSSGTIPYGGTENHIFSGKRRSYLSYQLDSVNSGAQARLSSLEAAPTIETIIESSIVDACLISGPGDRERRSVNRCAGIIANNGSSSDGTDSTSSGGPSRPPSTNGGSTNGSAKKVLENAIKSLNEHNAACKADTSKCNADEKTQLQNAVDEAQKKVDAGSSDADNGDDDLSSGIIAVIVLACLLGTILLALVVRKILCRGDDHINSWTPPSNMSAVTGATDGNKYDNPIYNPIYTASTTV